MSLEELIEQLSGPGIALWGPFVFLIACAFGFPMPEDIILVAAGFLGGKFGHPILLTMLITYIGIIGGDSCIFLLGSRFGRRILKTKIGRFLVKEKTLQRAESALQKHGSWVIFGARFLPGLRTAVFFSSGTLSVSFWRFFVVDGVAALISAPVFVYLGAFAWKTYSDNFGQLDAMIEDAKGWIAVAAVVLLLIGGVTIWVKRKIKAKLP